MFYPARRLPPVPYKEILEQRKNFRQSLYRAPNLNVTEAESDSGEPNHDRTIGA